MPNTVIVVHQTQYNGQHTKIISH